MASTVTTDAEVCNLALSYAGQRQFIGDLNEATDEARVCKVHYATLRDRLLSAHWWSFATKTVALAQLSGVTRTPWTYCYSLPADLLEAQYLWAGMRNPPANERVPYVLQAGDAAGTVILCTDMDEAELVYTCQHQTPAVWTPGFVSALAAALSFPVALGLAVKPQLAFPLRELARQELGIAVAADVNQQQRDVEPEAALIRERA